jgi:DNA-binding transcriptional MerR regulator
MQQALVLENELVTTSVVARALDCSEANVRRMAEAGELACTRLSTGVRLFHARDVQELAERRLYR